MRRSLGVLSAVLLAGCTNTTPPPVTVQMAKHLPSTVEMTQLQHGRTLFASRCIECHTLPPVDGHTDSEWPHLVRAMAKRASLKPAEQDALLAYVLAARSSSAKSNNP